MSLRPSANAFSSFRHILTQGRLKAKQNSLPKVHRNQFEKSLLLKTARAKIKLASRLGVTATRVKMTLECAGRKCIGHVDGRVGFVSTFCRKE